MTVVALASAKGSPGVTTTALALAWTWPQAFPGRRVLVVDADMAGGDIAAGYLQGAVPPSAGLLGLAATRGVDLAEALWEQVLALDEDGTRLLLLGVNDPAQAHPLGGRWASLARVLANVNGKEPGVDVVVDLGRLGTVGEARALLHHADLALLVLRSSLTAIAAARPAIRRLREERASGIGCLLIGERQPYDAGDVADVLGVPVLATIAHDPVSAAVFSTGAPAGWRFARSPLLRSVRAAAEAIRAYGESEPDTPTSDHEVTTARRSSD
jgi:Flp pilus assembly CpaE family ATPase